METYYARHTSKLTVDKQTKQIIFDENLIAIHYPAYRDGVIGATDNLSRDPSDYSGKDKEIVQTLDTLARNGGYVCVEYQDQQSTKVGIVLPNSQIRLLEGRYEPGNGTAVLKTLRMSNVRALDPWIAIRVLVGRPQRHSLCRWHAIGDRIRHLVEQTQTTQSLNHLLPAEQEILCSEFLRLSLAEEIGLPRLVSLLVPVGRTMKDLDILGLDPNGHILAAQVTYGRIDDAPIKVETLRRYSTKSQCLPIYFCLSDYNGLAGDVHVISLQHVFTRFISTDIGRNWLATLSSPTGNGPS